MTGPDREPTADALADAVLGRAAPVLGALGPDPLAAAVRDALARDDLRAATHEERPDRDPDTGRYARRRGRVDVRTLHSGLGRRDDGDLTFASPEELADAVLRRLGRDTGRP